MIKHCLASMAFFTFALTDIAEFVNHGHYILNPYFNILLAIGSLGILATSLMLVERKRTS